ncbi:methyltransferase [Streptomyces tricolor]|nr:methyltransferase [Streptomyces tricolor]
MGAYDTEIEVLADAARAALVREIDADGAWAADPAWREAFAAVPPAPVRAVLLRRRAALAGAPLARAPTRGPGTLAARRLRTTPGHPCATGELVSSSSQPSPDGPDARSRAALVEDGDRVLEVGAGTGYNAALLAHRLGSDDLVTTIDLEPEIIESARQHLRGGRPPPGRRHRRRGARGVPERAPLRPIIATCELPTVPRAWLAQCRPGARVLTPLATGLLALTVRDARHAEGRFLPGPAFFVPLRVHGQGGARGRPARPGRRAGDRRPEPFPASCSRSPGPPSTRRPRTPCGSARASRAAARYGVPVDGEHTWAWLDDPGGAVRLAAALSAVSPGGQ